MIDSMQRRQMQTRKQEQVLWWFFEGAFQSKNPEFIQELCGYNDVNAVVPSNGYNVFLKNSMIVFQR